MLSAQPFAVYTVNNLYDSNFFADELPALLVTADSVQDSARCFATIQRIIAEAPLEQLNESQLEARFIRPLFEMLGWFSLPQENKIIQGKTIIPDVTLFASPTARENYLAHTSAQRRDMLDGIVTFAEIKAADKLLDTKKVRRAENPFLQLLEYLTLTHLPFGFLTNGVEWWLVDNTKVTADKRSLQVNLAQIVADDNAEAFHCFYHLFHRTTYVPDIPDAQSVFNTLNLADIEHRTASEEDLRRVIYGTDGMESLFEVIGRALLVAAGGRDDPETLQQVYENSLYLVFRLLFIAYFEDRYWDMLYKHSNYPARSLRALHEFLEKAEPHQFVGWDMLQTLFRTLNEGNINLDIPLIDGGLFDEGKVPLLCKPMVINNTTLLHIFTAFFMFSDNGLAKPRRRDFKALSITHLSSMYESLLEFEFRVDSEDLHYIVYKKTTSTGQTQTVTRLEGFFDTNETHTIEKDKKSHIVNKRLFPHNVLYLVSNQNNRKASASFYTPTSLSFPLVQRAIDYQLDNLSKDMSVLDMRILDNACGSGHLLIESLNYLTRCALDRMDNDPALAQTLHTETARIYEAMQTLCLHDALRPDDFLVLKRILFKKVLYGVDVQTFAIELARLSLWIETFIYGTPLPLIEHHIKVGNALIGTDIATFQKAMEGRHVSMLNTTMKARFEKLYAVYKQLSILQDTTAEDVATSKSLFTQEIGPALKEMNLLLDLCNYRDMLLAEGKPIESGRVRVWDQAPALLKGELPDVKATLDAYRIRYGFFNWEIEFPEAFANGAPGFHIIVGNPPWDKTKFEDPMFFSQHRSNYRTLPNSAKAKLHNVLLAKPYIRQQYEAQKARILAVNEYYKRFYPLNAGSGDGNLFRFFVERNLHLLIQGGTLNYVLPTGLLTEDGSATLRKAIFADYTLTAFDGLENRKKIFPDVDSRYKFGLLQIVHAQNPEQKARTRFMLTDPAVLLTQEGVFEYSLDDIRATSPEHMAYMEVAHGRDDLALITRIYQQFPPLNPEWSDFRAELHATNDKSIFLEQKPVWINFRRELDATNDKGIFLEKHKDGLLPLYKGACIWQYDSLFAQPQYWLNAEVFDEYLSDKEISRLITDVYPLVPHRSTDTHEKAVLRAVGLRTREELGRFVVPDRHYFRLGFRAIARDTDERTLICALLPKNIGAQNSLYISIPKKYIYNDSEKTIHTKEIPISRLLFVQALYNSLCADWTLRMSIAMNVNKTFVMRQPIPQPTDAELNENPIYKELIRNSLRVSLHYNKEGFKELQTLFGLRLRDIPHLPHAAETLMIRNDVLVAKLYGINAAEMEHMLKSFKVLADKNPYYIRMLLHTME